MLANEIKLFFVVFHVDFHVFRMARCVQAKWALFLFVVMDLHVYTQRPFVVEHFITLGTRNVAFFPRPMIPGDVPQLVFSLVKFLAADFALETLFMYLDVHVKTPPAFKLLIAFTALHARV